MYVKSENSPVLNVWADSEINRTRLASGKYGVVLYEGEVEIGSDGQYYVKGCTPETAEPTEEEHVKALEAEYQLPRPVRTVLLLARETGQSVDVELMARVDEIEAWAVQLRKVSVQTGAGMGHV